MLDAQHVCAQRNCEVMRQLTLDLSADHIDSWNLEIWLNPPGRSRSCGRICRDHRNTIRRYRSVRAAILVKYRERGRTCRHGRVNRFSKEVLRNIAGAAVVMSDECIALAEAIVKNSRAHANNRLRRTRTVAGAGRPGKGESRSKIQLAAGVVLNFVTQAIAESQVWFVAPIILDVGFKIELADARHRIAGIDAERRRAASARANIRRRESQRHQLQSTLIALKTGQQNAGARNGIITGVEQWG